MYAVIILEQALEDLKDIVGYIGSWLAATGRAPEERALHLSSGIH